MSSTVFGSEDFPAMAGMKSFKNAIQYEVSVWSGGRGTRATSVAKDGIEATTCITELKKQVLPTFGRV
jgi:hypothetical protein